MSRAGYVAVDAESGPARPKARFTLALALVALGAVAVGRSAARRSPAALVGVAGTTSSSDRTADVELLVSSPYERRLGRPIGDGQYDFDYLVDGELHGPVHLMVGGLWGDDGGEWRRVAESEGDPDQFLLLSKFLWRQGFVRCPDVCSDDTPVSDCRCDCPDAIVEHAGSAYELLNKAGVLELWSDDNVNDVFTDQPLTSPYNVTYDDLLDKLCAVGLPGEMFTSAAPQDPIFWPLHGNAERFLQYVRLLNETGNITLDATWGYEHQTHEGSDTHVVCDWSQVDVTDVTSMPVCRRDTCPGHKAEDLLPYASLTDTQVGLYTNEEFYELTAPNSPDLTYVYNSLSYWPGCSNNHTFTVEYPSPTFAPTVNPKNERRT